jgi:hypothetical protein
MTDTVTVKPLVWEDKTDADGGLMIAPIGIGGLEYYVMSFPDETWGWYTSFKTEKGYGGCQEKGLSLERAQGNAKSHWEKFVRSALEPQTPAQAARVSSSGVDAIAAERQRQVEAEGWTPEHDDTHTNGAMAAAAAAYAFSAFTSTTYRAYAAEPIGFWPWDEEWWKPKDPRSDLVRAGALIAAEIDRIDRAIAGGE